MAPRQVGDCTLEEDPATFGAEYTRWEKALANSSSPEAKVNAKLDACTRSVSRQGSLTR